MFAKSCILAALIVVSSASEVAVKGLSNTDYYISPLSASFLQAWAYCKDSGYKFASIVTSEQNNNLANTLAARGYLSGSYWIGGLYLSNGNLQKWHWVDAQDGFNYVNWSYKPTSLSSSYDYCVIFNYSSVTKTGSWSYGVCGGIRPYVCQI